MRRTIVIAASALVGLLVLGAGAILILPQMIPSDVYRDRIQTAATSALGRDVRVEGDINVRVFPRIEARAGATTIANPEDFGEAPFASMGELRAAVKLIPLIFQRVEIDEFVLVEPNIALVVAESGTNNWTFDVAGGNEQSPGQQNTGISNAALGDVRIVNGMVSFEDRKTGDTHRISELDLRAVMEALDRPFDITASGQADDMPFDVAATIQNPEALLANKPSNIIAELATELVTADLDGSATLGDTPEFDFAVTAEIPSLSALADFAAIETNDGGALGVAKATARIRGTFEDLLFEDVDLVHESALLNLTFTGSARLADEFTHQGAIALTAPDLRRLATAAGSPLPPGDIYRTFKLSGQTSGGVSGITLTDAALEFDDIRATGSANLLLAGVPRLSGSLNAGPIDITPYASASGAQPNHAGSAQGWGSTAIDLAPLRMANAQISLDAEALRFRQFDFGPSELQLTLQDGVLNANVEQTTLFGGVGGLRLVADGSGATPVVGLAADIDGLSVQPLLQAAANFGLIDGTGDLQLDISGTGGTLAEFMSSLQGQGDLAFDQGALTGVDLGALAASAKDALATRTIPTAAFGANARTAFRNLKTNFSMQDGVAAIADLKFQSGEIAVSGGGALDIGAQTVNFTLFPQFANASSGVNGYGLPVKFAGGWNGIGASIDFDWLVAKATSDITSSIENEIQNELEEALGDNFGRLFGRRSETPTATTPAPEAPSLPQDATQAPDQPEAPPAEETPPPSAEDLLRREAGRALGDLLRND